MILTGTASHATGNSDAIGDILKANPDVVSTLTGTGLHDIFEVRHANDIVIAQLGGDHTIFSFADYTLPANVNTLVLKGAASHGTGNADSAGDILNARADSR